MSISYSLNEVRKKSTVMLIHDYKEKKTTVIFVYQS